jgi:class 3 adenylate cyclase
VAAARRHWAEAERHFSSAVRTFERYGHKLGEMRALHAWGGALLDAGEPARGLVKLDAALAILRDGEFGAYWQERVLADKLRAQGIDSTDATRSIDAVTAAVARERPDFRRHAAPDGQVTLMFSDMEGFTEMTERLGDRAAHGVIQAHNRIVRERVAAHGGVEVELQGDGFLLAFADARRALACAVAIQRTFAAYSAEHPEQPIRVRIGLHTGEAIQEADRFFGKTVILAARIAAQARGGEILISSALVPLAPDGVRVGDGRAVTLKGLAGTYTLHPVAWDESPR